MQRSYASKMQQANLRRVGHFEFAGRMGPRMNPSAKIWLLVIYAVNSLIAFLWLFLFGWHYAFHLAGVYFGPGILAVAVMLVADILIFILLRKKLK